MIYIYTFAASIFFAYLADRSKDKWIIVTCSVISILIPSVLGGLRAHGIGVDTTVYGREHALAALNAPDLMYFMENNSSEPGHKILFYVIMKTLGHENWCYFFYQLLTISCVYIGCWKHRKKTPIIFTMFMFFIMFYNNSLSIMRQSMAAAIVFMGFDNVEQEKYMKFALYVAIAAMFHKSAISALVLIAGTYYVINSSINVAFKFLFYYGTIIFLFLFRPIMLFILNHLSFYAWYITWYNTTGHIGDVIGRGLGFILIYAGATLVIIFYRKRASKVLGENIIKFHVYNNAFIIAYISFVHIVPYRALLFQMFISIFNFAALPSYVREKNLRVVSAFAVIFTMIYCWLTLIIWSNVNGTFPYRSILD